MRFFTAKYFWLLLLIPFVFAFLVYSLRDRMKKLETFYGPFSRTLIPGEFGKLYRIRIALMLTILVLVVVALARPQFGFRWIDRENIDSDVIIALDMSSSMLAEDVFPNRLGYAKRQISDFLDVLSGDRVGLIVFARNAYLVCPLTSDYSSIRSYVNDIDMDMVSSVGTSVENLLLKASNSFDTDNTHNKTILIFSDGEDHSENASAVAENISKYGIKVCAIGIGKEKGALIPLSDNSFKKNKNGDAVVTRMRPELLKIISETTGGVMRVPDSDGFEMGKFYAGEIRKEDYINKYFVSKVRVWNERYRWILIPALILLLIEYYLEYFINFLTQNRNALILLICFLIFPSAGNCGEKNVSENILKALDFYDTAKYEEASRILLECQVENPENLYIKYNLANCYYKQGHFVEAERFYRDIIRKTYDKILIEKCLYNLGNVSFKERKLLDSLNYYREALKIDKNDYDATYNLSAVERIIMRLNENIGQREESSGASENKRGEENAGKTRNEYSEDEEKTRKKERGLDDEKSVEEWAKLKKGISTREAELFLDSILDNKKRVLTRQLHSVYQEFEEGPEKDW